MYRLRLLEFKVYFDYEDTKVINEPNYWKTIHPDCPFNKPITREIFESF